MIRKLKLNYRMWTVALIPLVLGGCLHSLGYQAGSEMIHEAVPDVWGNVRDGLGLKERQDTTTIEKVKTKHGTKTIHKGKSAPTSIITN